ncbi:MAG TPA: hypothetical protein VGL10_05965 [Gammaproteobacteria bacterium]
MRQKLEYAVWKLCNKTFLFYESCYKIFNRLHVIDDFIYLKKSVYAGPERVFFDGTRLQKGDAIGVIHFNNRYLARIHTELPEKYGRRAAFAFGYSLVRSMRNLSRQLTEDPLFNDLEVISGITWFKPHGNKIGFESEPLAPGRKKDLLKNHFRILLYAMFPHLAKRENDRLEPHQFWLTKNRLLGSVTEKNHVAKRLTEHNQPRIAV